MLQDSNDFGSIHIILFDERIFLFLIVELAILLSFIYLLIQHYVYVSHIFGLS